MILRPARRVTKIELRPGQRIMVKGNLRMTRHLAESFLNEKWNWVESKYKQLQKVTPLVAENQLLAGQKILFQGQWLLVQHSLTPLRRAFLSVNEFTGEQSAVILYLPTGMKLEELDAKKVLKLFYNIEASKRLLRRVDEWAQQMQLKPQKVRFKTMRSRWGSCSSKGTVALNSYLVKAPSWVSDSVIVHELAHLQYMNHSKNFWRLVAQFAPQHLQADEWLKKNISGL